MNFKKITFFVTCALLPTFSLFSESFFFKYEKGVKYKIITTIKANQYMDNQLIQSSDTLDKVSVEIVEVKGDSGRLKAQFNTSVKQSADGNLFKQNEEESRVYYWVDSRGYYKADQPQFFPSVLHVPYFPEKEIKPGYTWEAIGEEIFDFRLLGVGQPVVAPMKVRYTYLRNEVMDGRMVGVFKIYYPIVFNTPYALVKGYDAPYKINAFVDKILYWDIARGRPYAYKDSFYYLYLFQDGSTMEFRATSEGKVTESSDFNKDDIVKELNKALKDVKNTVVEKEEDGITIRMENINFLPDSARLLPEEQEKIRIIAEALKKYPDKDILVSGHTALAGTPEGRQRLSEERARAVGEYLLSLGVSDETRLVYKGLGADVPLGDNSTQEGMKKNRRVEIKILEN